MSMMQESICLNNILDILRDEINTHREDILNKKICFNSEDDCYKFISCINSYKEKIEHIKKKCSYEALQKDIDKFFLSEMNFFDCVLDSMKKVLTNDNRSDDFKLESDIIYQSVRISKIKSDLDYLEKKASYSLFFKPKDVDVVIIDGKKIRKNDLVLYNNLKKNLDDSMKIYDSKVDDMRKVSNVNRDTSFIISAGESILDGYKKRVDEILNMNGKKVRVKIGGEVYSVVRKYSGEFRLLMGRIIKYSDSASIMDSSDLVIDSSLLSVDDTKLRKANDNCSYVGKITGFDGNFDILDNQKQDNRKFFGSISVENNDGEEVVYNDGKKSSMHHNHSKKRINILGKRKPINGKKMKKNIITASIALVMSLVTAVSSYAAVKMMSNRTDSVIDTNKYSTVSNDTKINKVEVVKNDIYGSLFVNNTVNDIVNVNNKEKNILNKEEEVEVDATEEIKDDKKQEVVKSDVIKDISSESIKISDKITIDDDASIYTNAYDACCENDGLEPYYDSDYVRSVRGVAFEDNNSVVFAYTQEEYDYLNSKGCTIKAVGCDDGFYNIDDVKTLSYSR